MKKLGIENLRKSLGSVMTKVGFCSERYIITRNFKEIGVLISWDDWKMIETMFRENDKKRELEE